MTSAGKPSNFNPVKILKEKGKSIGSLVIALDDLIWPEA